MPEYGEIRLFDTGNTTYIYSPTGQSIPVRATEYRRWTGGMWEPMRDNILMPDGTVRVARQ